LIPVDPKFAPQCEVIKGQLAKHDIRGFVDDRNETIGKKIRDNEVKKIPLLLIVGEKEIEANAVSVRLQGEGDVGMKTIAEFADYFKTLL